MALPAELLGGTPASERAQRGTSGAREGPVRLVGRRTTILAGVAVGALPALAATRWRLGPTLLRDRDRLATGARSGEVTTDSAVLWARGARPGRIHVDLSSNKRRIRTLVGDWTDARADHTARIHLRGLAPGRDYQADVWFSSSDGNESTRERLTFATAPIHAAAQSFVWSGDTCGQGWGINDDLGGLTTYRSVLEKRPDFFLHSGDTIYGDEPMEESVLEPNGKIWRNRLTESVIKVSETLEDYRGRHRYPLLDEHVRAMYGAVPTISSWDDHETVNNWYPGELHDDDRYTERRCDVLAARGLRAWQEYQPVPVRRLAIRGDDGFAPARIYRRVPRGQHLDVFVLDMRSYRGDNPTSTTRSEPGILGPTQEKWLIDSLVSSKATWKVVAADLPLSVPYKYHDDQDSFANLDHGLPLGREPEIARVLSALKRHGVRNVVWLTADVHYTAAHHYSPERAAFTDFDPFWEFVSGPIAAGTFGPKDDELDRTFGPRVEFSKGNGRMPVPMSPRAGNQFFGHVRIAADGTFAVDLCQGDGAVLWSTTLEPELSSRLRASRRS